MPVTKRGWRPTHYPKGTRYIDYKEEHLHLQPVNTGYLSNPIEKAIKSFYSEHKYIPRKEDIHLVIEFTTFDILIRVVDIYNRDDED